MILCASSTSIPSRFRITVELSTSVSAISLASSIVVGLITQTSIFAAWEERLLVRIGVILEEGAGLEIRSCLAGALAAAVFADDLATGALTASSSGSSSRKSSSSSFFFLENFSKNFFFGFSSISSSSSRKSSS